MTGNGWFSNGGYSESYPDWPLDAEQVGDRIPAALAHPPDPTPLDALTIVCRLAASGDAKGRRHTVGKVLALAHHPDREEGTQ